MEDNTDKSRPIGRPSKYTDELADKLCERIATSHDSLKKICKELDISTVSIFEWIRTNQEFANLYARAKEAQADLLVDEMIEIADDTSNDTQIIEKNGEIYENENKEWINRSKTRIDTRKWIASKLKPKKYGDKIDVTTDGEKIGDKKETFITLSNGTKIAL